MSIKCDLQAKADNSAWCEPLYDRKAAGLILYGRALGLSHSEAEDVLQDTFVALMALAEPPADPDRYALRAFRHRALNYKRTLWRRLRREMESHAWFERQAHESALEKAAMRCLARLPIDQREVIVLKIWHQHTFESIAGLLRLSPHTVAGRYRYGMEKLRTCLKVKGNPHEHLESIGERLAFLETSASVKPT